MNNKLFEFLSDFITDRRKQIICDNIKERTRYITVVLEDIFQPQNASAVLRTCDCFGIQDIHIIENQNKYNINPDVVLGATQWLTIKNYNKTENNTLEAINNLKNNGYRIIATTLSENNVSLNDFQLSKGKIALFFGTELTGLSTEVINNADEFLKIPMYGFTESFNISVSAAIILHDLTLKLRQSEINWHLSETEQAQLKVNWVKNTLKTPELLIKEFEKKFGNDFHY